MSKPSILTIPEAAALLGIPYTTLLGWVQSLPEWSSCVSHRNGRRVYLSTARMRTAGHLPPDEAALGAQNELAGSYLRIADVCMAMASALREEAKKLARTSGK